MSRLIRYTVYTISITLNSISKQNKRLIPINKMNIHLIESYCLMSLNLVIIITYHTMVARIPIYQQINKTKQRQKNKQNQFPKSH